MVIAGILKLVYTHWRVRKYTALEKIKSKTNIIREKSIIRSLSRRAKHAPKRNATRRMQFPPGQKPSVLFGIKALECGPVVEGVWNARLVTDRAPMLKTLSIHSTAGDMDLEGGMVRDATHSTLHTSRSDTTAVVEPHLAGDWSRQDLRKMYPPPSFMRYADHRRRRTSLRSSQHDATRPGSCKAKFDST